MNHKLTENERLIAELKAGLSGAETEKKLAVFQDLRAKNTKAKVGDLDILEL